MYIFLFEERFFFYYLFINNNAVLAGLVNLGDDNGALPVVGLVEVDHLLEGEVADHVAVEHKEGLVVLIIEVDRIYKLGKFLDNHLSCKLTIIQTELILRLFCQ